MTLGLLLKGLVLASCATLVASVSGCPSKVGYLRAESYPRFFVSPNYPGNYGYFDKRLSCTWLISAASEYEDVVIQIKVLNSSMEYSTACVRDYVVIYDGPKDFFRSLKSWCGSSGPSGVITSTRDQVLVQFGTDFKKNDYYGFMIAYWVAKKPIFIVNKTEWTSVNYALLGIGIALLVGGPGWLACLFIKRDFYQRIIDKRNKSE